MTIHRKLLIGALLAASAIVPVATVNAGRISVEIGDRPYYTHGDSYWRNGARYVWVPGHPSRHGWVRGHYVIRDRRGPIRRLDDGLRVRIR